MNRALQLGARVALAVASTCVALLIAEVTSRYVYPVEMAHFIDCAGRRTEITVDDPELEFKLKPDFCGKLVGSEFQNSVRTNSSGFRDAREFVRDKGDAYRIFALGDSYTFGWGVEQGQIYLNILAKRLETELGRKIEIFNLGVWGYGTIQEIRVFQMFKDYEPDLVILEFYGRNAYIEEWGNDLVDNYHFYEWYRSRGLPKGKKPHEVTYAAAIGRAKNLIGEDCNICRVFALEFGSYLRGNFHPHGNDELKQASWQITGDQLKEFDSELQAMNVKCLLLWIPPPATILAGDSSLADQLRSFQFHNIQIVSALDALSDHTQKYYYSLDPHWTPAGHQVAASLLFHTILTEGLIPSHRMPASALKTGSNRTN
jgi:GDSL-like Lipase/Acylhydrolase family